jgi:hypothetical protein
MPQPFLGSSLQSFPLAEIAHPSRGRQLPCSYPPTRRNELPKLLSPSVSPTSTLSRSCPVPPADYRVPFRKLIARFPVPLDLEQRSRSLPQASPTSKPYSPCESVRTSPSCPGLAAGTLLGFCPSGAFSFRASDPRPARARKLEHAPSPEDSGSRPRGPLDPPSQVRRLEHRNAQTSRR